MTTLTAIARQDNAERDAAIQRAERAEMLTRLPAWLTAAPGLSVDGEAG